MNELYADIVVPLAIPSLTFRVDESLRDTIGAGMCVKVQLGPSKLYTGIVWRLHGEAPHFKTIKTIREYVSHSPRLAPRVMKFWEWVAEYYMCTLGEVMRGAMPSSLKPEGFTDTEFLRSGAAPREILYLKLHPRIADEFGLSNAFESLKRAPKQYEALLAFVSSFAEKDVFAGELPRKLLNADPAVLKALIKKQMLTAETRILEAGELAPLPVRLPELTGQQAMAVEAIEKAQGKPVLLHGVTGSGKTEIYIHLINEQLRAGRNVMYLLPEIAMTSQLVSRISSYFGDRVVMYHSRVSDRKRAENYRLIAESTGGKLVFGVRSAVFMPVDNIGLIIVDEEHDDSYKQNETAPRYNARDCAVVLGRFHGAGVVLGSATPSVESYFNVMEGKYAIATLTERYGGVQMPEVIISDTITAVKRGERTSHFNKALRIRIEAALAAGEQVMLFQNRRGFSPYMECSECGYVPMCRDCNVSLTLHKTEGRLRCHYCGRSEPVPATCPSCGAHALVTRGFGTEKVEEEIARLFPGAKAARLDRDTAQSAKAYNAIIESFERGATDILIGTQMITKGFDFAGVSVVGILNADNLLNYPDFRAGERAYQIIAQMAGRAGRRDKRGEVVIQTSSLDNMIIRQAAAGDYNAMVRTQLAERADFFYPPYCRLISVTLKFRDKAVLDEAARRFRDLLAVALGKRLLGPQPPVVDRIKREFLLSFMIKTPRGESFAATKSILAQATAALNSEARFKYITVVINVDPV